VDALTGPDQRLDPLRRERHHQRAAHVYREDLALEPQRGPAEPAAAPRRGDALRPDQLVDQSSKRSCKPSLAAPSSVTAPG